MKRLFNETFFHFVLGFVGMLTLSLSITFAISYYDRGGEVQTATASNVAQ
jgi:hypothetical protein